jgi:hypothetical protein
MCTADLYIHVPNLEAAQACIQEATSIFPINHMISYMVSLCAYVQLGLRVVRVRVRVRVCVRVRFRFRVRVREMCGVYV